MYNMLSCDFEMIKSPKLSPRLMSFPHIFKNVQLHLNMLLSVEQYIWQYNMPVATSGNHKLHYLGIYLLMSLQITFHHLKTLQ